MHEISIKAVGKIIKLGLKLIPFILTTGIVCSVAGYPLFTLWTITKIMSFFFFFPAFFLSTVGILAKEKNSIFVNRIMEKICSQSDDMETRAVYLHYYILYQKKTIFFFGFFVFIFSLIYYAVMKDISIVTLNSFGMLFLAVSIFPLSILINIFMDQINRLLGFHEQWKLYRNYL